MKKLAIEFTNGERKELVLQGNSVLFIDNAGEPKLLSDSPDIIIVDDTTQELAVEALVIRVSTGAVASVATIADGLYLGQQVAVKLVSLSGVDTLVLTSATGLRKLSDGTALTSLGFNAANEYAVLRWTSTGWQVVDVTATETV